MNHMGTRIVNFISMLLCLMLIAPIAIVIFMSFDASSYMTFPPTSFSLRWFESFLKCGMDGVDEDELYHRHISVNYFPPHRLLGSYALVRGSFGNKKVLLAVCLLP